MFPSGIISRRVVVRAIGAGAVTGTLLCATAGTAVADPPPPPPDCTGPGVVGGLGEAIAILVLQSACMSLTRGVDTPPLPQDFPPPPPP
jgi:hypothetical protein